jgi:hypothetical protein
VEFKERIETLANPLLNSQEVEVEVEAEAEVEVETATAAAAVSGQVRDSIRRTDLWLSLV